MKNCLLIFFFLPVSLLSQAPVTSYVNPFVGTAAHGHTFPGAVMPFGMVQLSPDTRVDGSWDGSSGYHYSDSVIYGFSHTHLSGTGVSDWGDILLMPLAGEPTLDNKRYASSFSHGNETAAPGYYSVLLNRSKIRAELTVTPRTGIHRYESPAAKELSIVLDLLHRDKTLSSAINVIDSVTVSGSRVSEAWAREQHVYFAIRFSKPFKKHGLAGKDKFEDKKNGPAAGAFFTFNTGKNNSLMVKVAISPVSEEGALRNLETEAPHWLFDQYRAAADSVWQTQLSKVKIAEGEEEKKRVFYTALYHCFIHPSLAMDVDGQYRGRDLKIHTAKNFTYYSVFSLWDTYRALHPLLTLFEPERTADFINTFLTQYQQCGRLPVWELSSNETNCMIGFHAVSVIADALSKGIYGYDSTQAYEAAKAAAHFSGHGIQTFNKKGYLEADDESESVSKTIEYAYNNWCLSIMAARLRKSDDIETYRKRALAYRHLFDAASGFMRPRKNGNWITPFAPEEVSNHFTEANSWQYSFYAPHDMEGLIELHGGREKLEAKLDALFSASPVLKGRDQPDVTGLIGQYAHGNEPSHHIAYLYNYVGKPQKTIALVRKIMNDFYRDTPDGLIGNEDCGQMSAWYVFSALGMYPVCPGSPHYVLGEPLFKKINVDVGKGRQLMITSDRSADRPVLRTVNFFGRPGPRSFTIHHFIKRGGKLQFHYTSEDDTANTYGRLETYGPRSRTITRKKFLAAPLIQSDTRVFSSALTVSLSAPQSPAAKLLYTVSKNSRAGAVTVYDQPFVVDSSCTVKVLAVEGRDSSAWAEADFFRLKYDFDVKFKSLPDPQYGAEGGSALIDGIRGDADWRKGDWLGWQGEDVEIIVDLRNQRAVSAVSLSCLQDTRSWIVFPQAVQVYGSVDNKNFFLIGSAENTVKADDYKLQLKEFAVRKAAPVKIRYLKIQAKTFGTLPEWHAGKGGKAYIFCDELIIE